MLLLLSFASAASFEISVRSVSLAPTQPDGSAWDGPEAKGRTVEGLLQSLLSPDMVASAQQAMKQPEIQAMALPDVSGQLSLSSVDYPSPLVVSLPEVADSLNPSWCSSRCPTVTVGRLHRSMRLQLSLTDVDLMEDDPIGTVEIGVRELRKARRKKEPFVVLITAPESTAGATVVTPLSILSVEIQVVRH